MDAKKYCKIVEEEEQRINQLIPTISIIENNSPLVSLKDCGFDLLFEPSIKENYRYLVRKEVAEKIGRICELLEKEDKTLIIRSVWRSFDHQRMIWENKVKYLQKIHPDKTIEEIHRITSNFIAPPNKSMHSTGGSVDALIFDRKNVCIMDFGTNKGLEIDLTEQCYPYHPDISPLAKSNRKLLIDLFENENFVVDLIEYWHFDFGNAIWSIKKNKEHAIYGLVGEY